MKYIPYYFIIVTLIFLFIFKNNIITNNINYEELNSDILRFFSITFLSALIAYELPLINYKDFFNSILGKSILISITVTFFHLFIKDHCKNIKIL